MYTRVGVKVFTLGLPKMSASRMVLRLVPGKKKFQLKCNFLWIHQVTSCKEQCTQVSNSCAIHASNKPILPMFKLNFFMFSE